MPGYLIPGYDYPSDPTPAPARGAPCHPGAALVLLLRRRAPVVPPDPDLFAAVAARLRAFNSGSLPAALGENLATPGGTKVWGDEVLGSPALPWVRVTELGEPLSGESGEYDGLTHYYGEGLIQVSVFAASKSSARSLRDAAVSALTDAPLTFDGGALMHFRPTRLASPPEPGVGPGAPQAYHCLVEFTYFVDRTF